MNASAMQIVHAKVKYKDTYGRMPSLLFIGESGFDLLNGCLVPAQIEASMFPIIGTFEGGRVFYVAELSLPYYWQDAIILDRVIGYNAIHAIGHLKVVDPDSSKEPKYFPSNPSEISHVSLKTHEVPTCVIEAYKEFLCN